ncbi:MAG: AlkA N-terminal domain-containing protein [Gammaproteobacteria bacterium]
MPSSSSDTTSTHLELPYRPPLDWAFCLDFHRARAIDGVERIDGDAYVRVLTTPQAPVLLRLAPGQRNCLHATLTGAPAALVPWLEQRLRAAFDLDADPAVIAHHLARDARLAPLVAARPGLRVAGCVDAFEQAVRAILGQQISVRAAIGLATRLSARWGAPVAFAGEPTLTHAFPTPQALCTADVASLGMPRARGRAVAALAAAVLDDAALLTRAASLEATLARLTALAGIGAWSAHYIAMRALREADAFPASDVGILRALAAPGAARPDARAAMALAEAWRPWRAYAAQHLWAADAVPRGDD